MFEKHNVAFLTFDDQDGCAETGFHRHTVPAHSGDGFTSMRSANPVSPEAEGARG
jgi:hypothetical protein